jgi:hypothetical protein
LTRTPAAPASHFNDASGPSNAAFAVEYAVGLRKLQAGIRAAEQADRDVLGTLEAGELDSLRQMMLRAFERVTRPH